MGLIQKTVGLGLVAIGSFYLGQDQAPTYGERNVDQAISTLVVKANDALDQAEKKYIVKDQKPEPNTPTKCQCNGTKEIVHGDGHKTPCTCSPCECKKPGQAEVKECNCSKEDIVNTVDQSVRSAFDNYVKEYRERAAAAEKAKKEAESQPTPQGAVQ